MSANPEGTVDVPCPECGKLIKPQAVLCRYCRVRLSRDEAGSVFVDRGNLASVDAEGLRREHLGHERAIRAISVLKGLGAAFLLFGGITLSLAGRVNPEMAEEDLSWALPVLGLWALALAFIAYGLWHFRPWARILAICNSAVGLMGFPIGTLVSGYILYILLCKKGETVFGERYREVAKQTPHLKAQISGLVWALVVLSGGLVLFGLIAVIAAAVSETA